MWLQGLQLVRLQGLQLVRLQGLQLHLKLRPGLLLSHTLPFAFFGRRSVLSPTERLIYER